MVINANMTPGFYVPPMWQASHHFHHPKEFKDGRAWPGETSTPSDTGIFQCMKPLHLSKETSLFLTLWNIPLLFTAWRFNIRRKITFPPTEWYSWMRYRDEEDPIPRLQVVKMRKCSEKGRHSAGPQLRWCSGCTPACSSQQRANHPSIKALVSTKDLPGYYAWQWRWIKNYHGSKHKAANAHVMFKEMNEETYIVSVSHFSDWGVKNLDCLWPWICISVRVTLGNQSCFFQTILLHYSEAPTFPLSK